MILQFQYFKFNHNLNYNLKKWFHNLNTSNSDVPVTVIFESSSTYSLVIGGKSYHVTGTMSETNGKLILSATIDGVRTKSHVVFDEDSVHLFSSVSIQ